MQVVDVMLAAIALTLSNCLVVTSDGDLSSDGNSAGRPQQKL